MNPNGQRKSNRGLWRGLNFGTLARPGVVIVFLLTCGCARETKSRLEWQPANDSERIPSKQTPDRKDLPPCPPGDAEPLRRGSPHTDDHRVSLSWNASKSNAKSGEIGYCLYRSKDHPVKKSHPKRGTDAEEKERPCEHCERVNVVPVRETNCVDDIVKDGTLYYYVAIAVDKNGLSGFSNQAPAKIPGKNEPPASDASSYKSCRARDKEH